MSVYPLGRKVLHDPRSLNYPAPVAATHKPVSHLHHGPVMNQGQVGSCTGNAMAQAINTEPFYKGKLLTEADALNIYSAATKIDNSPGSYPPDDTGSSGLSVAKVARHMGLIRHYRHAFGLDHAIGALQLSPLLFGTHWYQDMFTPDRDGFVHPGGALAGGHEILVIADTGDHLVVLNSWGPTWGVNGTFLLTYSDFGQLLADSGDIVVPGL
jgi:hypothetical protein